MFQIIIDCGSVQSAFHANGVLVVDKGTKFDQLMFQFLCAVVLKYVEQSPETSTLSHLQYQ